MHDHMPIAFSKALTSHHPTKTLLPASVADVLVDLREQLIERFVRSSAVIVISGGNDACLFCKAIARANGKYATTAVTLCGSYNNANDGWHVHVPLQIKVLRLKGQSIDTGALVAFVAAPCCHAVVQMTVEYRAQEDFTYSLINQIVNRQGPSQCLESDYFGKRGLGGLRSVNFISLSALVLGLVTVRERLSPTHTPLSNLKLSIAFGPRYSKYLSCHKFHQDV